MALPMPFLRRLLLAAPALAGLMLGGCGPIVNLGEQPPENVFRLQPLTQSVATAPKPDWRLLIDEPAVSGGLDNNRIAVMTSPLELRFLSDARWSQRLAGMVQSLMIDSFESGAGAMAMTFNTPASEAPYVLSADIRNFEAEVYKKGSPQVRIRIAFTLSARAPTKVLAHTVLTANASAASNKGPQLADAFDKALKDVLTQLVTWTVAQVDAAP